jgi:xanthine dehydrogenase accessory factor
LGPGARPEVRSQWLSWTALESHSGFPSAADLRQCLTNEVAKVFRRPSAPDSAAEEEVFVEPWLPKPQLVIIGAGHIGQELAAQASRVGFEIIVVDDRPEFMGPKTFPPGTLAICGELGMIVETLSRDADAFVVIVTRSAQKDAEALVSVFTRPTAYVGMIGSQRKVQLLRRTLVSSDAVTEDEFDRVYAPIGLNIGAVTVPEIAASIVAQLIAVRRRGVSPTWHGDFRTSCDNSLSIHA